jgi:hypothetical protein
MRKLLQSGKPATLNMLGEDQLAPPFCGPGGLSEGGGMSLGEGVVLEPGGVVGVDGGALGVGGAGWG